MNWPAADFLNWFDDMDRLRAKVARLIHCDADDIAFIPNASTALGMLLAGLDWRRAIAILTLEDEFPNNLYAPGLLDRAGVEMVECPWERFYESVDARTRLVCLSSVNYNTGFAPPLAEISRFLRERGVLLYVDGTQSVGALRFDVSRIQPDMLAVHAYKWMISPNGAGFMYVRPELRARLRPNVIGWRSHRDWRNVDNLHHGVPELSASAEKYEGGTVTFALLYAMEASIDLMLEIGPEVIEQRVLSLAEKTREIVPPAGRAWICAARRSSPPDSRIAMSPRSQKRSRKSGCWCRPAVVICACRRTFTTTSRIWRLFGETLGESA